MFWSIKLLFDLKLYINSYVIKDTNDWSPSTRNIYRYAYYILNYTIFLQFSGRQPHLRCSPLLYMRKQV